MNAYKTFPKTRMRCRGIVIKDFCIPISHEVTADYYFIQGGGLEADETKMELVKSMVKRGMTAEQIAETIQEQADQIRVWLLEGKK